METLNAKKWRAERMMTRWMSKAVLKMMMGWLCEVSIIVFTSVFHGLHECTGWPVGL